jgi:hypothetical protein
VRVAVDPLNLQLSADSEAGLVRMLRHKEAGSIEGSPYTGELFMPEIGDFARGDRKLDQSDLERIRATARVVSTWLRAQPQNIVALG